MRVRLLLCHVVLCLVVVMPWSARAADAIRITEFMALNNGPIVDEDGVNSDWIEIHNAGTNTANLNGWGLTDRFPTTNPWRFPSTNLGPNQYMLVFASGNDRRVPGAPLHTDFRLSGDGEYLALLEPGGTNVASSFGQKFPRQTDGISYGVPVLQSNSTLLASGAIARVRVPEDGSLGTAWTLPGFDDAAWASLPTGIGFEADGEVPFVPTSIAISVAEFSGAQGQGNWFYGYWSKADDADATYSDADFTPFPNAAEPFGAGNFWTGSDWDWFNGDPPFTQLTADGGLPSGAWAGTPHPDQWVVRRYVSEFDGPLKITGRIAHTSDWVRVTATGVAGTSPLLYVYLTGLGEGYLDELKLVAGSNPDVGANLIVNGDFENSVLAPNWTVSPNLAGSTVTTAASRGGVRSLRVVSSAGGSSQSSSIWQSVAGITAGQTYTLSYWYLPATNSSPLVARFSGSWIDTTPEHCGDGTLARIFVDGTEVFQQRALVSSTEFSVTVPTQLGSRVDFVIDPGSGGDATCDGTLFTANLETSDPAITTVADSAADWSLAGKQGEKNWYYGYFNAGSNTNPASYQASSFTPFPRGAGPQGTNNFWDGEKWEWFNGRPPHDRIEQFWMTPNGTNSGPIHWAIKRWVSEVSGSITVDWSALKEFPDQNNAGGGGVTMRLFHNGVQRDVRTVAGGNVIGVRRTVNLTGVSVGDTVDIAVDPANAADGRPHDDTDRTFVTMTVRGTTSVGSEVASDVRLAMQGASASAYLRLPFAVENPAAFSSLKLRMKYDDGFVAYLNGDEVARDNAPLLPDWASSAPASRLDSDANEFVEFDISSALESLRAGENILAIHGLNRSVADGDFLILPELVAGASTLVPGAPRYFMIPTPGEANGIGNTNLGPLITLVGHTPNVPERVEALWVTATVSSTFNPVGNVSLVYRVMFGGESTVPMFDDGLHGDGGANDGVWGARIPSTSDLTGQMIRYYVFATDSQGSSSRFPAFLDPQNSPEYQGTVTENPTLTNGLPVLHLFVQNQVAATNYVGTRGSIFWDGEFFDNIKVSAHGQTTWFVFAKRSMNFNLNTGHKLSWKRGEERVKAFDLLTTAADKAYMRMTLAFEAYRDVGVPTHFAFPVRLQQNGVFHSIMTFTEQANDDLLQRNGLDPEGALYKIYFPLTNAYSGTKKATRKTEPNDDLQALIDGLGQTGVARRNYLFDHVDVAEVVNWMATIEFVQNEDCCFKNYYVYRDSRGSGEWQMLPWDHDLTFGRVFVAWAMCGANRCGGYYDTNIYATNLYSSELRASQSFIPAGGVTPMVDAVLAYADTQEMFYRRWGSVQEQLLQPQNTHPLKLRMERRIDELATQMAGDAALDFAKWLPLTPLAFATNETFATGISRLKNQYLKPRRNWVFNQLNYASGGPYLGPQPTNAVIRIAGVEYNPAGSQAREYVLFTNDHTFPVDVSGWQLAGAVTHVFKQGTVLPGRGSLYLSPDVKAFRARTSGPRGGQGLFVQGNYQGQLSAWGESLRLIDTTGRQVSSTNYPGAPSPAQRYLRITELMYHPPASPPGVATNADEFEYIELRNISTDTPLNLVGVKFTRGIDFAFASNGPVTTLAPGASTLVVRSIPAFNSRYGAGAGIAGQWVGQLDNQGEVLRLEDANGEKILEFDYEPDWYPITDGIGFSLVIRDATAPWETWDVKSSWRPSGQERGAPGQIDPAPGAIAAIRINEVLTHTDLPAVDMVELFNPTANPVNLRGWFLSDDFGAPRKYRIATDLIIAAGGYRVFDESAFNPFPGVPPSFAFSSLGDEVFLFSGDANTNLTGYFHGFRFGAADRGVPFGRYVTSQGEEHFVAQTASTPNAANPGPSVGPIVVSEFLFRPPDLPDGEDNGIDEFIELQNVSSATVPLFDPAHPGNTWQLAEAVDYLFPTNISLLAGGRLVVVGFDPADASMSASFRGRFGVAPGIPIFGPYSGKLDNSTDRIELYKPDAPVTGVVPYVLVEAVEYEDRAPWPTGADGTGASLRRLNAAQYGNDPVNWIAAMPSPGASPAAAVVPTILVQPSGVDGIASQSAAFSVVASGGALMRFQWRFNGVNLDGATNATLALYDLQPTQAGQYSVAVYNPAGVTLSSNATLRVLYAAYITAPPLTVSLRGSTNSTNYGATMNNATFNVTALGSGVLRYQWRFNGVDIPGATTTSLTVSNVDLSHDGDYQVAIADDVGTIVSTPVRLNVLVTPIILIPPVSQSVITGATFTVGVTITGNPAPFGYEWRQVATPRASNTVAARTAFASFNAPMNLTNQSWRVVIRNQAMTNPGVSAQFFISTVADSDGDGAPDNWESDYGLDPGSNLDRDLDADGDGMRNWQEYVAGTNPLDPLSYLKIDSISAVDGANLVFGAISNRTYTIEFTDDLRTAMWTKLTDLPARNSNRSESVIDAGFTTNRMYRLLTPRQP